MTKHQIASLTIKLMGAFILIKAISAVPIAISSLYSAWSRRDPSQGSVDFIMMCSSTMLLAVLPFAGGFLVIVLSDTFAKWLTKDFEETSLEVTGGIQTQDVMVVAVSCLGLYFALDAIPNLISNSAHSFILRSQVPHLSNNSYQIIRIIALLFQAGIGIFMFIGSSGIVKFWKKIRSESLRIKNS